MIDDNVIREFFPRFVAYLALLGAQLILLGVALAGIHLSVELRRRAEEGRSASRNRLTRQKTP
jgi:hypothetical protein